MYGNPAFIFIPIIIILSTFYAGIQIEKSSSKKGAFRYYLAGIIINVMLLVIFKYFNFFTSSATDFINIIKNNIYGQSDNINNSLLINVIIPLGISYITFQAISYLIEIKRGNQIAEKNIGHFAVYLLFFPKIIAGPIERSYDFLPQIKQPKKFNLENISAGLKLILWGAFKKLVIADRLALYVSAVFDKPESFSGIPLLLGALFFSVQLYADFSGYTDMALGIAKILGYDLIQNFRRPFFSKSITEFWRKWHISLSTWFADYFYTPLVIAKRNWGNWSIINAFFITFIVLGFWHGANWTFIVFGALHAAILTIEFFTKKVRKQIRKSIPTILNTILSIGYTFLFFTFSLVFFRSGSVTEAIAIIKKIGAAKGSIFIETDPSTLIYSFMGIAILMLVELKQEYYKGGFSFFNNQHWLIRNLSYALLVIIILLIGVLDGGQFIYVQF